MEGYQPEDRNSFETPLKVVPVESSSLNKRKSSAVNICGIQLIPEQSDQLSVQRM